MGRNKTLNSKTMETKKATGHTKQNFSNFLLMQNQGTALEGSVVVRKRSHIRPSTMAQQTPDLPCSSGLKALAPDLFLQHI